MRREFLWIVFAAALLAGCGSNNTINLIYYPAQGKVVLHPKPKDVIVWRTNKNEPITSIGFPLGSPCASESELKEGRCTVTVPDVNKTYKVPYTCDDCADPEIVVGSEIGPDMDRGTGTPPTGLVQMACTSNQVTIYPKDVPIPQSTVTAGHATVKWTPAGITPIGDDWTTNDLSSICSNGPTFHKGNDTCNLKTSAVTTNFTVSSASCNNTSAPGSIKIQ